MRSLLAAFWPAHRISCSFTHGGATPERIICAVWANPCAARHAKFEPPVAAWAATTISVASKSGCRSTDDNGAPAMVIRVSGSFREADRLCGAQAAPHLEDRGEMLAQVCRSGRVVIHYIIARVFRISNFGFRISWRVPGSGCAGLSASRRLCTICKSCGVFGKQCTANQRQTCHSHF
jgi:hypothetical protein